MFKNKINVVNEGIPVNFSYFLLSFMIYQPVTLRQISCIIFPNWYSNNVEISCLFMKKLCEMKLILDFHNVEQ